MDSGRVAGGNSSSVVSTERPNGQPEWFRKKLKEMGSRVVKKNAYPLGSVNRPLDPISSLSKAN